MGSDWKNLPGTAHTHKQTPLLLLYIRLPHFCELFTIFTSNTSWHQPFTNHKKTFCKFPKPIFPCSLLLAIIGHFHNCLLFHLPLSSPIIILLGIFLKNHSTLMALAQIILFKNAEIFKFFSQRPIFMKENGKCFDIF